MMTTHGTQTGPLWEMDMINGCLIRRNDLLGLPNFQYYSFTLYLTHISILFHFLIVIAYFKHFVNSWEWSETTSPISFRKCNVINLLFIYLALLSSRCNGISIYTCNTPTGWGPCNDDLVHSSTEYVKLLVTHFCPEFFRVIDKRPLVHSIFYTLLLYFYLKWAYIFIKEPSYLSIIYKPFQTKHQNES